LSLGDSERAGEKPSEKVYDLINCGPNNAFTVIGDDGRLLRVHNCFGWQYNPLVKGVRSVGPFITWAFQEKALVEEPPYGKGILWCYRNDRTAVIEKSRDMGASWLFLFLEVWMSAFEEHIQILDISRSADAVDSASKNSLFQKIRFIHDHCPEWLIGTVEDQKFNFKYRRTQSEITGEASTGRAGTGGRASVVFVDEFSEIKEDVKVRQNTASIADCRFFNGTHLGVGTEFYNLTKSPEIVKIQMHWSRHPRKNDRMYSFEVAENKLKFWKYDPGTDSVVETRAPVVPFPANYSFDRSGNPSGGPHPGLRSVWYDKKAAEIGTIRQVAMELDINPSGSSSQFYEPLVIKPLLEKCRSPEWVGNLDYDHQTAEPRRLNPADDGPLRLWFEPGLMQNGNLGHAPPGQYVIGADVATGGGATPSCLSIFDASRGIKVGRYLNSRIDPKDFAWYAVSLCKMFRTASGDPAFLIWEFPGPGIVFGHEVLKEIGYRRIYWKRDEYADGGKESQTPGWFASPKTKYDLHAQYQSALRAGLFTNYDTEALEETLSYVHANGSVEHPRAKSTTDAAGEGVNHGDMVVADAVAWWMGRSYDRSSYDRPEATVLPIPTSILGRRLYRQRNEIATRQWV
jgi:hypothetical protein